MQKMVLFVILGLADCEILSSMGLKIDDFGTFVITSAFFWHISERSDQVHQIEHFGVVLENGIIYQLTMNISRDISLLKFAKMCWLSIF